ncbi:MAG: hypothetical protein D6828_00210 [Nitrospirae bacterium]|nr:MAG: hypothetical protein D6828_00210 [Nitrospirota bacterium]
MLTGVFGTIISLILALSGASKVLSTTAQKGTSMIFYGMHTALTTTATAIVCFFIFTYFYQKLTDIQTHLFSKIEDVVMTYIVPEFAFDTEAVSYKTEKLVKELREIVEEIRVGSNMLFETFGDLKKQGISHISKMDELIEKEDNFLEKANDIILRLDYIRNAIKEGFRLGS